MIIDAFWFEEKTYEPEQGAAFTQKIKLRKRKITFYENEEKKK